MVSLVCMNFDLVLSLQSHIFVQLIFYSTNQGKKEDVNLLNWLRDREIDCSSSYVGQLTCCAV